MHRGQASRTAEFMAFFRAVESARPAKQRLFHDPYAFLFLRPALRFLLGVSRLPIAGRLLLQLLDSRWPGARSSGVARTAAIDETLRTALRDRVDQVVILGAGFDCRAYRIAGIEATRVFEVDHPDTLARKRACLRRVFPTEPAHVRFVGTDFNQQLLTRLLADAGFAGSRRTFFLWEGVSNYLTDAAVDALLRWLGMAAPGSFFVFTYVHRRVLEAPDTFPGTKRLFQTLQQSHEPWTFGFDPAEVPHYLAARGLELISDEGAADYRARYLRDWPGSIQGYEFYRLVVARVRG